MKSRSRKTAAMLVCLGYSTVVCMEQAVLILSGIDTLNTRTDVGFDFVAETKCSEPGCNQAVNCCTHFEAYFQADGGIHLQVHSGYSVAYGKINLDSIVIAPPESVFSAQTYGEIARVQHDSLKSSIGNVYVIKTATDVRELVPFRAKIEILGFNMIDSANNELEMRFLWAYNPAGQRDLTTSGLDTFHLEPPVLASRLQAVSRNAKQQSQTVFRVVGGAFRIPGQMGQAWAGARIYDVRGRFVGKVVAREAQPRSTALPESTSGVRIVRLR